MSAHRLTLQLAALALAAAGAAGLSSCASAIAAPSAGPSSATPRRAPSRTAPSTPAPSAPTPTAPAASTDLSITFAHAVRGRTLTFSYTDKGHQHEWIDPTKEVYASHESAGHRIDFGDGQQTGSDGGAVKCSTTGSVPFTTAMPQGHHTYAAPGTYVVTVSASYCGAASDPKASGPLDHVTRHYTVVVR